MNQPQDDNHHADTPADQAIASSAKLDVDYDPLVSLAAHQNDIPVIRQVRVHAGDAPLPATTLHIEAPGAASPWQRALAPLPAGSSCVLDAVDLPLDAAVLHRQTERHRTSLRLALVDDAGHTLASRQDDLYVLAPQEWPGLSSLPELMAAFVLPNHPAVQAILSQAGTLLRERVNRPSLSGYQSMADGHVAQVIEAVYDALAAEGLGYIVPPASYEQAGQKVRLPHDILAQKLGTCFDLALLLAACFEQAGLNPLIVLVKGHAFVGVWTIDHCFAEPAMDDAARLRKRAQLGEILLVEATAITHRPAMSLATASRAALAHLQDDKAFTCALDIRCARNMSIRPLPMSDGRITPPSPAASAAGSAPASDPVSSSAAPAASATSASPAPHDKIAPPDKPADEPPAARIERWKRRLLDLSLHNRLLNHRPTRMTLPLLAADLGEMENTLAQGQSLTLHPRPKLMDQDSPRSQAIHQQRTGQDALANYLSQSLGQRRLHVDLAASELETRLVALYRAAKSAMEDSGANILYLAIGFLAWYESPGSTQRRLAPILLVPVTLERESARSDIRLSLADQDPMINVTLMEKLRADFGLSWPGMDELTADEAGLDVPLILNRFRALIKDIPRWDVLDEAHLGLFSFAKFLMWRDLQERAATLMHNPVVRFLVERPDEPFDAGGGFPDPATIDQARDPAQTFCPRDADSSQLSAVYAASDGRSFVLEGPPGTGKSQTITNLIAQSLAQGKRVLFVSEKMAALSVVQRRLTEVGLGPFCLELHSNKASKRQVLNQLAEAMEMAHTQPPHDWQKLAEELGRTRQSLNALVDTLHQRRPIGLSVYQVTVRLSALRDAPRLDLPRADPAAMDEASYQALLSQADQAASAAQAVGQPMDHPLRALGRSEWSAALPDLLQHHAATLARTIEAMQAAADAWGKALALPALPQSSLATLRWAGRLGQWLKLPGEVLPSLLGATDWPTLKPALEAMIALGQERDKQHEAILKRYQPEVFRQELVLLRGQLAAASSKWWLPRWLGQRAVRHKLSPWTLQGQASPADELLDDLDIMIAVHRANEQLTAPDNPASQAMGDAWRAGQADWDALCQSLALADAWHALQSRAPGDLPAEWVHALASQVIDLRRQLSQPGGEMQAALGRFTTTLAQLDQAIAGVTEAFQCDAGILAGPADAPDALGRLHTMVTGWQTHGDMLNDWTYWRRVRSQTVEAGLAALIDAYEGRQLTPTQFRHAVERAVLHPWYVAVSDGDPLLRSFNSTEHHQRIEAFRTLDKAHMKLSSQCVQARLAQRVPPGNVRSSANSEMGVLQRQLKLQRNHMPVRQLIARLPNLLPRLKPCLLMSPLSVAQYLDADFPPFDVVVFDEASQIPVWDAVGAIARGSFAVVVGDSKQLPPTNFFTRLSDEDDDADEDDLEELESILDECSASGLPSLWLSWHYRSRHESLIAFSNHHYYDNRLQTFPSAAMEARGLGVSMRYLADAVYDRSRSRTNPHEAQAVVDEIVQRLTGPSAGKSLGVVTFSLAQQRLIENLLDKARQDHPQIEPYFSSDMDEPVFIKNLENVQGDERAAILFSVCYGPDDAGKVSMNFGPLNREGGQRRLNVAITRAREEVVVFSSLRADQIDLRRSNRTGVAHFKTFLDYARRGPVAITQAATLPGDGVCESPFEEQVAQALRQRGWDVETQVGCSGYRIDLGVRHPDKPGTFLLGIECDGASYHSGKTARDRDRIRQGVLESLGWRLHRIWSTDWWRSPDHELDRIDQALQDALRQTTPPPSAPPTPASDPATADIASPVAPTPNDDADPDQADEVITPGPSTRLSRQVQPTADTTTPDIINPQPMPPGSSLYEAYNPPRQRGGTHAFYAQDRRVVEMILAITRAEAPVSRRLIVRKLMTAWDVGRQTTRLDLRVNDLLNLLEAHGRLKMREGFIWQPTQQPGEYKGFRIPAGDDRPRELEDIPPQEIASACLGVLRHQISLPLRDLAREVARLFGVQRVSNRIEATLIHTIQSHAPRLGCLIEGDVVTLDERA